MCFQAFRDCDFLNVLDASYVIVFDFEFLYKPQNQNGNVMKRTRKC